MGAIIKHNGQELIDALCSVNTANNIIVLDTMWGPDMKLDPRKVYVEVNIFGDLEPMEDEEEK